MSDLAVISGLVAATFYVIGLIVWIVFNWLEVDNTLLSLVRTVLSPIYPLILVFWAVRGLVRYFLGSRMLRDYRELVPRRESPQLKSTPAPQHVDISQLGNTTPPYEPYEWQ